VRTSNSNCTNTNPYVIKAIAVGKSGCACGTQKVIVYPDGVERVSRGARVCVLSLMPVGPPTVELSSAASFLCVVAPRSGLYAKHR
jgi:hypothetical protein